ncbi:MAG TPA: ABC transporter permease [Candidatus Acidoferrales bacterium]|nr:ABC transporter permease [Candidatus Acidoferrales bacterium]
MNTLLQDLRYGLRMLGKSPAFTAIAVLTLALGIGANTAIFSFTDQVLLRMLPVPNPEQLVVLRSPGPNPGRTSSDLSDNAQIFSYPMYKDLRERGSVFSGLLACFGVDVNVSGHGSTQSASGELVSGNYFQTLEVQPALGRVFDANDETAQGANPVAVLSYGYWTRQFGADSSILNRPLTVNGVPLTVVGVARKGFDGVQVGSLPDIFIPITMLNQMAPTSGLELTNRTHHWVAILGRLKRGVSRAQAQASLQPIYASLLEEDAKLLKLSSTSPRRKQFLDKPLQLTEGAQGRQAVQPGAEEPLLVLLGMVALVLLIACANLASLLVARGEARQREIAVRLALGAGRWRLVRQLLTESLLIGIAGGVAGLAFASWCLNTMVSAIPSDAGMTGLTAKLDPRVLWFAAAITIVTSVLFGLAPALRATRVNLQSTLKDQGSSVSEGRSNIRLRKVLIISQVALTAVLLAGAGLLARTLANLEHANLGVRTENILQFSVEPDLNGDLPAQTQQFADRARQEIAALPGVRSVTASAMPMFAHDDMSFNITPEGYIVRTDEDTNVLADYVGPNFFSTMGIPLMAGREFTEADTAKSQKVIIINEKLAQRFFAGRNPIGLHIARGGGSSVHPDMEIVGVVADSKWDTPRSAIVPFLYMPYAQNPQLGGLTFYVRTERDPAQMAATLHSTIQQLDSNLPVNDMRPLTAQIQDTMFNDRLVAILSISLALLAALLAALGLFGVLAYVVARRTREIGIRMALGGQRRDILRLVLGQGAQLTVIGGVLGIVAALALARLMSSLLFGVGANDPLTFVAVAILLVIVSGAACYIPARRAVRVDPMVALRYE